MASPIIGIDLGTTNCAVSKYERGKATILPINGYKTTPSALYFDGNICKVGHDAKKYLSVYPEKCLISTKRKMGTDYKYNINGKEVTPIFAATLLLKYLKEETEKYLNEVCNDVVITVPAYFGFAEREATKQAALNAGWNLIGLLEEPTAAAIAYGQNRGRNSLITVIDLGGGTFDVTVLEHIVENERMIYRVLAVDGNQELGGDDFDDAIVEFMIKEGANGYQSKLELKDEAEKAKIALSQSDVVEISCRYVETTLDRSTYKSLINDYLEEICDTITKTIKKAGKTLEDIDRFVLVGGSCKHPIVKEAVKKCVGRDPFISDNMDTSVAEGATLYHHMRNGVDLIPMTVDTLLTKTLGTDLQTAEGVINVVLAREGSRIPCKIAHLAYFGGDTLHTRVLQGDAHFMSDCKELYEMVVPMKFEDDYTHKIITIFDIDDSMCLSFYTYEIQEDVDCSDIVNIADKNGKFDYNVWDEFLKKLPVSSYNHMVHKFTV